MLAGGLQDLLLNGEDEALAVFREQFHPLLGRLVGTEQAVRLVVAGAVAGRVHDVVETADRFGTCLEEDLLGAGSRVDVAVQDMVGVVEDGFGVVRKDDLDLRAFLVDEVRIIIDIVDAGELMLVHAEVGPVLFQRKNVRVGVDVGRVELVEGQQAVADFVRRVGQHQDDLFAAPCDAAKADRETVPGQDREDDADGLSAEFFPDVVRNVVDGAVVALCASHDGLGHGDDVPVTKLEALELGGLQNTGRDDLGEVVPFPDDRHTDTAHHGTDSSFIFFHDVTLLLYLSKLVFLRWRP